MMARALSEHPYPGDFFMLGIIHRDQRNPEALRRWLENLRPDVITLEISRYSLDFRRSKGKIYREKLDDICASLYFEGFDQAHSHLENFYSFIEMPLEFMIAEDYRRRNNIHVYPVDMDLFSFLKLRKIDELINRQNVQKSLARRPRNARAGGTGPGGTLFS